MNIAAALIFTIIAASFVCISAASTCGRPKFGFQSPFARVNYTLWRQVNNFEEAEHVAHIEVSVPVGVSFYQVMQVAQLASDAFRFEATLVEEGVHYVTSIGGLQEIPRKAIYWVPYKLPFVPDTINPFPGIEYIATKGVDGTFVKDGDNLLFYFQRVYVR